MSLVPVLMVMGLLTPVFGPVIDHHYVDRSAAHAHMLIGEETNIHEPSLIDHDHSLGETGGSDGISLATSTVSTATGSSVHGPLTLDGATLESSIPQHDHHLIEMYFGEFPVPDSESIAPLDRPPRKA